MSSLSDKNTRSGPRPRLEGLSDLIFGLALSLTAYSLLTRPPTTMAQLATDLLSFSFSFLILISVWLRYTGIMSVLPVENTTTRVLNVATLFTVSLEPYLFNLVTLFSRANETVIVEYTSAFFAVDMASLVIILTFFVHELTVEEKHLIKTELVKPTKRVRNSMVLSTLIFLSTLAPQFWQWRIQNVPLRFYMWLIPIIIFWVGRLPGEPKTANPAQQQKTN
jgi:uncharacterized membrane protein